ncbi:hypothetical protein GWI33_016126 [Rhynchophorus ferrugineus]|uniref:Trafficking protein particle complex subunit 11 n=1 Tax=Rhynchophorus ferrugineus TaxID=354439 RepID=A0A834I1E6_RHYFE|nr:hypothetical protein GWI33_016126 [Rhynchophorus ferrugineus]
MIDWNDSSWIEKMIECASRVQSLRATLEGRDTRIIVVLIQNNLPIPEDPLAAERAIALCSSCELNSQSLYVLPHGQHLLGYTIRLESAFFEFCQNYYQSLIKNIKQHKEHLNKSSHQYLYVRHQFKMAFLSELRQDIQSAHKHYTLAYNNLLDIRIVDTNALEIRTIAGFINYKICKLMFVLNLPRDAISQFKSHIDKFKTRIGFQELVFEHYAWLSKQLEIFADIFDDAVKHELPALQTQHPGIYYEQAAQYAIARKNSCQDLCSKIIAYPSPDPLEGIDKMEFFAQRPWRPGKIAAEPPEPVVEANGIQALQFLENQINHSGIIISLYGLAIAQYKIYKCPRTRRHLILKMAEECYDSKDFGKALTLFTHMLSDYRQEKWWVIISNILEKAIKCAFLTANVQDYIHLAFEILGSLISISSEDKKRIYENLNRILKKQIPFGDPKLPHDILQNAIILWQPVFNVDASAFTLDMTNITSCIETKVRFAKPTFEMDQNVILELFVKSFCPFPLTFSDITVKINSPNINSEFSIQKSEDTSLVFHPNEVKKYNIEFESNPNDINKEVQVEWVNIQIGKPDYLVNLKFGTQITQSETIEKKYFHNYGKVHEFKNIKPLYNAVIVPRNSKIKIKFEHAPPILLEECYKINISITNEELNNIKDMKVEVHSENTNTNAQFSLSTSMKAEKLPLLLPTPSDLTVNATVTSSLYVKVTTLQSCNLNVKITYILDNGKPIISIKNELVTLPVCQPFEVSTAYFSILMQEIQKFYAGEEFGVMPIVKYNSPWPIQIENTSVDFMPPIRSVESKVQSHLAGCSFNTEEIGTELFLAISEKMSDQNMVIGDYTITWKRENGLTAVTKVTLHGHHCDWIPLNLKLIAPAHGYVRTPLIIEYHLINHSSHLVQLDGGMETSKAFMYSGYRQFSVSILPNSTKILQYNLYPLMAGSVTLPRIILSIPENSTDGPALRQDQLNQLIDRNIPQEIFIMPQSNTELPEMIRNQLEVVS